MSSEDRQLLDVTFRSEVLQVLLPALFAGECCALIGTSGVGKSNLGRFLRRQDVQERYGGPGTAWFILIDSHAMAFGEHAEGFVVTELMLHRLIIEAEARGSSATLTSDLTDLHSRLIAQPSAFLGIRYLERACTRISNELRCQIVFVFDQFENLWTRLDAQFFLNLRNLRDQLKYRLAYLVMTREPLQQTRSDLSDVESFWELFSAHTIGLGMYTVADASAMVDRLAERRKLVVTTAARERLLALSGRHPALLRALFWTFEGAGQPLPPAEELAITAPIAEECAKLWNDLGQAEQELLTCMAKSDEQIGVTEGGPRRQLAMKGLLGGEPPRLFSPVFQAYVRQMGRVDGSGVIVDTRLRQIWLDGQPISQSVRPLEFELLAFLARHVGQVCRREEILRELYKENTVDVNDQRLDSHLSRLREVLGEDGRNPRYLVTHRGVGYQLTRGGLRD